MDPTEFHALFGPVIVALVPFLIALLRRWAWPSIPKPLIPVLAAALGPALDQGIAALAGMDAIGWAAAGLGLAGIGLREMKKQLTPVVQNVVARDGTKMLVLLLALGVGACAGTVETRTTNSIAATCDALDRAVVFGENKARRTRDLELARKMKDINTESLPFCGPNASVDVVQAVKDVEKLIDRARQASGEGE